MAKMSLELSDGLQLLKNQLSAFDHEPRILDPQDARILIQCVELLRQRARELENEVSAKRWNDEARKDRIIEAARILSEVRRPGSNVTLFPVIERPIFDGVAQ